MSALAKARIRAQRAVPFVEEIDTLEILKAALIEHDEVVARLKADAAAAYQQGLRDGEKLTKSLLAEPLESLRGFARAVMEGWPDAAGLDGFELQDLAEKFGLLQPEMMAGPCGEACQCAELAADWPARCYRKTALLRPEGGGE